MKRNIEVKLVPVSEKLHLAKAALSACSRGLVWEEMDQTNFCWQIGFFAYGYFSLCTCFAPLLMGDKVIKPWNVYRAHLKRYPDGNCGQTSADRPERGSSCPLGLGGASYATAVDSQCTRVC